MNAHIGVDVASGAVHTLVSTTSNEADINQMAAVLHGRAEAVFADARYTRVAKRPEHEDREAPPGTSRLSASRAALNPERLYEAGHRLVECLNRSTGTGEHHAAFERRHYMKGTLFGCRPTDARG
jgi:IS5 family transposase